MIKVAVDIDRWNGIRPPAKPLANDNHLWAFNYLRSLNVLPILLAMYKTKRRDGLPELLAEMGIKDPPIYCNAKGLVVFHWSSTKERTLFLLKWS